MHMIIHDQQSTVHSQGTFIQYLLCIWDVKIIKNCLLCVTYVLLWYRFKSVTILWTLNFIFFFQAMHTFFYVETYFTVDRNIIILLWPGIEHGSHDTTARRLESASLTTYHVSFTASIFCFSFSFCMLSWRNISRIR